MICRNVKNDIKCDNIDFVFIFLPLAVHFCLLRQCVTARIHGSCTIFSGKQKRDEKYVSFFSYSDLFHTYFVNDVNNAIKDWKMFNDQRLTKHEKQNTKIDDDENIRERDSKQNQIKINWKPSMRQWIFVMTESQSVQTIKINFKHWRMCMRQRSIGVGRWRRLFRLSKNIRARLHAYRPIDFIRHNCQNFTATIAFWICLFFSGVRMKRKEEKKIFQMTFFTILSKQISETVENAVDSLIDFVHFFHSSFLVVISFSSFLT